MVEGLNKKIIPKPETDGFVFPQAIAPVPQVGQINNTAAMAALKNSNPENPLEDAKARLDRSRMAGRADPNSPQTPISPLDILNSTPPVATEQSNPLDVLKTIKTSPEANIDPFAALRGGKK